jgi:hypothetical protein
VETILIAIMKNVTVSVICGLAWAGMLVTLLLRARRNYSAIPLLGLQRPQSKAPDCMVVIPARDEEDVIATAVRSLPPDTVIVADDGSGDDTPDVASAAGAGVGLRAYARWWFWNVQNACAYGAATVTTKWLLFCDADTSYEPGFLESAIATADASGVLFLSVHLDADCQTFAETTMAPLLRAIFYAGVNTQESAEAGFLGQCVLVQRDPYEFIGGHRGIMPSFVDDVALATVAHRHRLPTACVRANGLGRVRPFRSWRGLFSDLWRSANRFTPLPNKAELNAFLSFAVLIAWIPIVLWVALSNAPIAAALGLVPLVMLSPWYRGWRVVLAPLASLVAIPAALYVVYDLTLGNPQWKGREV